ncbi:hypothetical protein HK101_007995 [Irineochytrium annulatum]|nr:hypothetical protein HK101_007995 [Irineochytrium annulatum]
MFHHQQQQHPQLHFTSAVDDSGRIDFASMTLASPTAGDHHYLASRPMQHMQHQGMFASNPAVTLAGMQGQGQQWNSAAVDLKMEPGMVKLEPGLAGMDPMMGGQMMQGQMGSMMRGHMSGGIGQHSLDAEVESMLLLMEGTQAPGIPMHSAPCSDFDDAASILGFATSESVQSESLSLASSAVGSNFAGGYGAPASVVHSDSGYAESTISSDELARFKHGQGRFIHATSATPFPIQQLTQTSANPSLLSPSHSLSATPSPPPQMVHHVHRPQETTQLQSPPIGIPGVDRSKARALALAKAQAHARNLAFQQQQQQQQQQQAQQAQQAQQQQQLHQLQYQQPLTLQMGSPSTTGLLSPTAPLSPTALHPTSVLPTAIPAASMPTAPLTPVGSYPQDQTLAQLQLQLLLKQKQNEEQLAQVQFMLLRQQQLQEQIQRATSLLQPPPAQQQQPTQPLQQQPFSPMSLDQLNPQPVAAQPHIDAHMQWLHVQRQHQLLQDELANPSLPTLPIPSPISPSTTAAASTTQSPMPVSLTTAERPASPTLAPSSSQPAPLSKAIESAFATIKSTLKRRTSNERNDAPPSGGIVNMSFGLILPGPDGGAAAVPGAGLKRSRSSKRRSSGDASNSCGEESEDESNNVAAAGGGGAAAAGGGAAMMVDEDGVQRVIKVSGNGGGIHSCTFEGCGKTFSRPHNLKSHMKTHTDERPFGCQFCSQRFRRNHDLKRHERLHTDDRPYVCEGCNKGFGRSDALSRHVKIEGCVAGGIAAAAAQLSPTLSSGSA